MGEPTDDAGWIELDGHRYLPIPYGSETVDDSDPFGTPCHVCGAAPGSNHRRGCTVGSGPHVRPPECRDCGTVIGAWHVMGCCIELCPRCGFQFASCDCEETKNGKPIYKD